MHFLTRESAKDCRGFAPGRHSENSLYLLFSFTSHSERIVCYARKTVTFQPIRSRQRQLIMATEVNFRVLGEAFA